MLDTMKPAARDSYGSARTALPTAKPAAPAAAMEVRLAYARVSSRTQEIQSQVDALEASGVHRLFQEQISTRVRDAPRRRPARRRPASTARWERRSPARCTR